MRARNGQVAVYLVLVLVAIAVLMVMNVNVFLAVRSKNRIKIAGACHQRPAVGGQGLRVEEHLGDEMKDYVLVACELACEPKR